ncbi:MAG: ABC transporter permease [Candidatus Omnitrophota bacterium]
MLIRKLSAFFKKDFLLAGNCFIDTIANFLMTFLFIGIFYFLAKIVDKNPSFPIEQYTNKYFSFVFIGIIFIWYSYLILDNFSREIREYRITGLLEVFLTTPTKTFAILLGANLWNIFFSTLQIIILLLLGRYFLGVKINSPDILSTFLILMLTLLIFISIGLISAAISILFSSKRDPALFLINCAISFLCGAYFPISLLPESLQRISHIIPMTYALRGLRQALLGGNLSGSLPWDLMILTASLIILMPASFVIFNYALKKMKTEGGFSYG